MMQQRQRTDTTATRTGQPGRGALALLLATTLGGTCLAGPSPKPGAGLYRWVDETGTTVYSQLPPPATAATPATTVTPAPPPPAADTQRALDRVRSQVERDFDKRDQKTRDAEEAGKKAKAEAARQEACEAARKNLDTLQNHGLGRLRTADGKSVFLTKEELASQKEEAQKQIAENCK